MEFKKKYNNLFKLSNLEVQCLLCSELINVKLYKTHLRNVHRNQCKNKCIWCLEAKENDYIHCYQCMLDRIKAQNTIIIADNSSLFLQCEKCDKFLKSRVYLNRDNYIVTRKGITSRYYGVNIKSNWALVNSLLAKPLDIQLFIDEVGFDTRWFYIFKNVKNIKWFHCTVRQIHWDRIFEYLNNNENLCILPNWCLCDGGSTGRHVRHFVLFCPTKYLKVFNKNLKFIIRRQNMKRDFIPIETMRQFINAINYVSHENSIFHEGKHYYIHSPVIPHFKFICFGLFRNSSDIIITEVEGENTIHKNHTLPYKNILVPTKAPTAIFLFDKHNRKIYFTSAASPCATEKNYTQRQCTFAIFNSPKTQSDKERQTHIVTIISLTDQIARLEEENNNLKKQIAENGQQRQNDDK
ncbi:virion protein [Glossina pallidipes salivary gland hypertrophy virus]|uniref:Virion protein n=1 Tax=Glossina hytrovirus (isolate Glossina pallidipes/Ethiopia/Seibersdorf/-) TaxID=379529 RepID=A0A0Y0JA16_GHVS|nr:virion protein [Glossina pallidipes salivary gland hypertrophy virus]